jgi:hypothetical protein
MTEAYLEKGLEPPPEMLPATEEPDADAVVLMYWNAFQELQSERPLGGMGGAGSIPWTAIDRYAERHGHIDEGYYTFIELMRFLDNKWLKMQSDKQKKERRESKAKSKSKPRR